MPDMNENAETQQEYFGKVRTDNTKTLYNALNKIAELEKENAELRAKESFVGDQNRKLCEQQQKIEVLEAENAELKKQLEMSNKVYNDNLDYSHHIEGQLTKAKRALRKVVDYLGQFCSDYPDCVIEAEQFLKGGEVEK